MMPCAFLIFVSGGGLFRQENFFTTIHRTKAQANRVDRVLMGWTPPDGIDVPKWRC